jgi:hypothetical protein
MSPDLTGADAKLRRAQEQIDELQEEIAAFIESRDSKPYTTRRERHNERVERKIIPKDMLYHLRLSPSQLAGPVDAVEGGFMAPITIMEVGVHLDPLRPFPALRFGMAVGEIVHNLRCALDYLIWELSVKHQRQQPPLVIPPGHGPWSDWRRLQFPIFHSRDAWNGATTDSKRRRSQLWAIDQTLLADFERLQPYDGGKNPFTQWLWMLQELWNGDKHRAIPIVAIAGFSPIAIPGGRIVTLQELSKHVGTFDSNTELARYEVIALRLIGEDRYDPAVDVNPIYKLSVAFDPGSAIAGEDVTDSLRSMATEVKAILDQFRPLL